MSGASLTDIPDVDIDESGVFKYIQIKISKNGAEKIIVRGYSRASYHADIAEEVSPGLEALGFKCSVLGGGRIEKVLKSINVYGYSVAYGQPNHQIAVEKIKTAFPTFEVTWSNEGY